MSGCASQKVPMQSLHRHNISPPRYRILLWYIGGETLTLPLLLPSASEQRVQRKEECQARLPSTFLPKVDRRYAMQQLYRQYTIVADQVAGKKRMLYFQLRKKRNEFVTTQFF
jgi:hypothetical protein